MTTTTKIDSDAAIVPRPPLDSCHCYCCCCCCFLFSFFSIFFQAATTTTKTTSAASLQVYLYTHTHIHITVVNRGRNYFCCHFIFFAASLSICYLVVVFVWLRCPFENEEKTTTFYSLLCRRGVAGGSGQGRTGLGV